MCACVHIHFSSFFSSDALFQSRLVLFRHKFFLLELECERDTNALKHTHTHTHAERVRAREERARDARLFFFVISFFLSERGHSDDEV